MKRTIIYLTLIIILVLVTIWMIFRHQKEDSYSVEREFVIRDTSEISGISLKDLNQELILGKVDSHWMINNRFRADSKAIGFFLGILSKLELHSVLASSEMTEIIKQMTLHGVEVKIFEKGRLKKEYSVLNTDSLKNRLYIKMPGADYIYIVAIPGYNIPIFNVFNTNINNWRNKNIFSLLPSEIQQIEINYYMAAEHSFRLINSVSGRIKLINSLGDTLNNLNYESAQMYIGFFRNFNAYSYIENPKHLYDSLIRIKPEFSLTIFTTTKIKYHFIFYPIKVKPYKNETGKSIDEDTDLIYAILERENDVFKMKYTEIDPVIKEIEYFINP